MKDSNPESVEICICRCEGLQWRNTHLNDVGDIWVAVDVGIPVGSGGFRAVGCGRNTCEFPRCEILDPQNVVLVAACVFADDKLTSCFWIEGIVSKSRQSYKDCIKCCSETAGVCRRDCGSVCWSVCCSVSSAKCGKICLYELQIFVHIRYYVALCWSVGSSVSSHLIVFGDHSHIVGWGNAIKVAFIVLRELGEQGSVDGFSAQLWGNPSNRVVLPQESKHTHIMQYWDAMLFLELFSQDNHTVSILRNHEYTQTVQYTHT